MATRYRRGQRVQLLRIAPGEIGVIVVANPNADRYEVRIETGTSAGEVVTFGGEEIEPIGRRGRAAHTGMADPGGLNTPKPYVPTPEHLADIKAISDRLQDEAEERDWCEDYNEVVEDLNRSLTVKLPLMEQEYTVVIQGENYDGGLYSADEQEEVTVDATSEDEAVAKVADIVNKYLRGDLIEKPKE